MKPDDLKKRTKQFALRVLKLVAALPNNLSGRTIGGQLVRAGTSVGANYRAACRARSKREFIAKIGIVEEEADESAFWLDLLIARGATDTERAIALREEASQIVAITVSSIRTARRTPRSNPQSAIRNPQSTRSAFRV